MKNSFLLTLLSLLATLGVKAQNITVHGTVISKTDSEPLIGATVMTEVKGSGTVTDIDGKFEVSVAPGSSLTISYIGYQTVKVKASPDMTVELSEDSEVLNEVVVVGYSTQRKVDVTPSRHCRAVCRA